MTYRVANSETERVGMMSESKRPWVVVRSDGRIVGRYELESSARRKANEMEAGR